MVGESLTAVTQKLTNALGIRHAILPMTDAPVATKLDTVEQGELDFQEYFVRYRWQPTVAAIRFDGIEQRGGQPGSRARHRPRRRDPVRSVESLAVDCADSGGAGDARALDRARRAACRAVADCRRAGDQGAGGETDGRIRLSGDGSGGCRLLRGVINGFVYDERDAELKIDGLRTVDVRHDHAGRTRIGRCWRERYWNGLRSGEAAMSIWAIIPVKPLSRAKSRLAGVLSPEERKQLSEMLFRRVLTAVNGDAAGRRDAGHQPRYARAGNRPRYGRAHGSGERRAGTQQCADARDAGRRRLARRGGADSARRSAADHAGRRERDDRAGAGER